MSSHPSNHDAVPDHVGAVLGIAAGELAARNNGNRSIANIIEPKALTAQALEQRKLIHPEVSARRYADPFREIRTRLLALGGATNFVTMVTSVSPRSGSSFVARNLAAAFALEDAKTALLIDCDMRHPSQHAAFSVDPANGGLIDYLEHPSIGIEKILYRTGVPRLRLIPAGARREASGEYYSSFRMRATIDSLRSRYPDRYLFLDGPTVKGSPDARILAELADFVVLVVGDGRDTADAIARAASSFDPGKLAGVVFNQTP
jgi:Mrp family chromosome partitioning ATPase